MRLELLHNLMRIVDQCKACALASTVLGSKTEAGYLVFVGFVEFGELGAEFVFGDVGAVGVEDVAVGANISATHLDARHQRICGHMVRVTGGTHTTICFRPRRALRMNLRVRSVTGCSRSAMFAGSIIWSAKCRLPEVIYSNVLDFDRCGFKC